MSILKLLESARAAHASTATLHKPNKHKLAGDIRMLLNDVVQHWVDSSSAAWHESEGNRSVGDTKGKWQT